MQTTLQLYLGNKEKKYFFIAKLHHGFITRRYYEINAVPRALKFTRPFGTKTEFHFLRP